MTLQYKLEPELKTKWLLALRSGRYTQGQGYLKQWMETGEPRWTHCCLGVLGDELGLLEELDLHEVVVKGSGHSCYLYSTDEPESMADLQGLEQVMRQNYTSTEAETETARNGIRYEGTVQGWLATMNDANNGESFSFAEIAKWIEENL